MRQRGPGWAAGARGEDLIDWEEDHLHLTASAPPSTSTTGREGRGSRARAAGMKFGQAARFT